LLFVGKQFLCKIRWGEKKDRKKGFLPNIGKQHQNPQKSKQEFRGGVLRTETRREDQVCDMVNEYTSAVM